MRSKKVSIVPIHEQSTEKLPVVSKPHVVNMDTCSIINRLIDHRWSSVKLFVSIPGLYSVARVTSLMPSYINPGYLIVNVDTIEHGPLIVEVGTGVKFSMFFA